MIRSIGSIVSQNRTKKNKNMDRGPGVQSTERSRSDSGERTPDSSTVYLRNYTIQYVLRKYSLDAY